MNESNMEMLKTLIINNDSISEDEKKEFISSLEEINKYNVDLNKDERLKKLLINCFNFLKNDSVTREDKLLRDYGLSADASIDKIEARRDEIISKITKEIIKTKYFDRAKSLRTKRNLVISDFKHIIDHLNNRSLSGDLNTRDVKVVKANSMNNFAKLVDGLSEFAVETELTDEVEDTKNDAFTYAYEDMSDAEIAEAKKDLDSHPINYVRYGENVSEYLEPIEYYPNTNVRKPRIRGPFESIEHYNAFLKEYFSRYDFSNSHETTIEETNEFYTDKLDYVKTRVEKYFREVKDALSNLRWLYNYSLNEKNNLSSDIKYYKEQMAGDESKVARYKEYQAKDEETIGVLDNFINKYTSTIDSVNDITCKLFNEPTLKGDIVFTIQLDSKNGNINGLIAPYMSLSDEEERKKYANYVIDTNGDREVPNEFNIPAGEITNVALNNLLNDFIKTTVESVDDLDEETIKSSNIEVIIDGKTYVMPVENFGINVIKILQLGPEAYEKEIDQVVENEKNKVLTNNRVDGISFRDRIDRVSQPVRPTPVTPIVTPEQVQEPAPVETTETTHESASVSEPVQSTAEPTPVSVEPQQPVEPAVATAVDNTVQSLDVTNTTPDVGVEPVITTTDNVEEQVVEPITDSEQVTSDYNIPEVTYEEPVAGESVEATPAVESVPTVEPVIPTVERPNPFKNASEVLNNASTEEPEMQAPVEDESKIGDAFNKAVEDGILGNVPEEVQQPQEQPVEVESEEEIKNQEELHNMYKVIGVKKPRHSKKTIALGVLGGVLSLFGILTANAPLVVAGSTTFATDILMNVKNAYRAVQKHKLKQIAKNNDAKVYFSKNHGITMRSIDGYRLNKAQAMAIQKEIDEKINSKLDLEYVPRVKITNLEDSFIIDGDKKNYYVASKKDEKQYRKMIANDETLFNSIEPQDDYLEDDEPKTQKVVEQPQFEYQEHAEVERTDAESELQAAKEAVDQFIYLNPGLQGHFNVDDEGYWIELQNPEDVVLPEGFVYDGVDGFNNFANNNGIGVAISVYKPVLGYNDLVDEVINKYGDVVKNANDDELKYIASQYPSYSYETLIAARDKMNVKSM